MKFSGEAEQPRRGVHIVLLAALAALLLAAPLLANGQPPGMGTGQPPGAAAGMPNARQMSGIPMPMEDVPVGTVIVRVVRDELSNTLPNVQVQLEVGGRVLTAKTDAEGRAQFPGVAAGATAKARAVVNGETLESQPFQMPPDHGVRLLLVSGSGGPAAGIPAATPGAAPPSGAGPLTFGGQSRIHIEMNDDAVEVFYLLEITNRTAAPMASPAELVFQLPDGATQGSTIEGSSTQVQVRGTQVMVSGPFQPGTTPVQVAFTLLPAGPERSIRQAFPLPLDQLQVLVAQAGNLQIASPQFSNNGAPAPGAGAFIVGTGPAIAAGAEISLSLSGIPTRSSAWRRLTIGLVVIILMVGAWAVFSARPGEAESVRRAELQARRERLLSDLARLEEQRRSGAATPTRYASRRSELTAQLERVYGELDQQAGPLGGDQGQVA
jgi:hypothetical protein